MLEINYSKNQKMCQKFPQDFPLDQFIGFLRKHHDIFLGCNEFDSDKEPTVDVRE